MADSNTNDDLPHLIMGFTALEHRKTNMKKILSFLHERNHSRYNKSQLLRRLYEVESGGHVSHARQQAIDLWLRRGAIGHINVYYDQNDPSRQSQASRVLKRKRSAEPISNGYTDIRIKHEESIKSDPQLKECSICAEDLVLANFSHQISAQCTHDPTCCSSCLSRSIGVQIGSKEWNQIRCPECAVLLSFDNVKFFASEADFISDPNFTNCLGPGCNNGQIHEGGDDQPIMTCGTCSFKTCFTHKMPWHTDFTCEGYDDQSREKLRQEEASQDLMDKATKRCPNCQVRIEKNKGCDHMTYSSCEHEFCWICFVAYRLIRSIGNAAHLSTCHYFTGNLPRHPDQIQSPRQLPWGYRAIARSATPGPASPRTAFTPQELSIVGRIRASQTQRNNLWDFDDLADEEF
ncbi:putative ring finger protein [Botrytis fragariae]|uniref:RBR-type E3 ubiquitin transferase n=1 Tax=Botrytis fragariae TaxID=1964551 RepID=A0A8H6B0P0_9HELO|nr:putative ring finger protein [Botrytis fragariae]KAF5876970.1 putative ring finger protein [Botrytis fragariae]